MLRVDTNYPCAHSASTALVGRQVNAETPFDVSQASMLIADNHGADIAPMLLQLIE